MERREREGENRTRGRCNDTVTLTTTINERKTTNHFNRCRRRRLARFQLKEHLPMRDAQTND